LIGDGAFGSLLQQQVSGDFTPDELNLSKPDLIERVHYEYASAGADFICTNTFGASPIKLASAGLEKKFKAINRTAVSIARKIADLKEIYVAGDMGPCGQLMEPLGPATFDGMMDNYGKQAQILESAGVDFILLETITDIQEFRAAVIGIMASVKIPVLATMSFTNGDLSLSGTDGRAFAVTSDFSGLRAVGTNCGTSLENMRQVMAHIAAYSHLPLICQPNAGLPVMEDGKTVFKINAQEFCEFMEHMYGLGVSVMGSCCGSTPEYTEKLALTFKNRPVFQRQVDDSLVLSSRTAIKEVSTKKFFLIGERINPTGRKKLQKELQSGRLTTVRLDAKEQEKHGADALDININLHKTDMETAKNIIKAVQNLVRIPLVIDSLDPHLIESFAKIFAGKGVINSISGEKKYLKTLLPLACKYNLAFIALLMDDKGIPETAKLRLKIAERIVKQAKKHGIPLRNIIFDPLVLSAGAEVDKVSVTLETLDLLKKKFPLNKRLLGLSNISFGLPNRELVNSVFLALGAGRGADIVICNPANETIRRQILAVDFLRSGCKENLALYTNYFSGFKKTKDHLQEGSANLYDNILEGDTDSAVDHIAGLMEKETPMEIIEKHVMPAMNEVGRRYHKKEYFLPQLIAAADAVKAILPTLKAKLPVKKDKGEKSGILFAAVKGDLHDIGKNLVISILESFNFSVVDLGKDVSAETIVAEALKLRVEVIGLSVLMTTTIPAMLATVKAIKADKHLRDVKIFVGGAVINREITDEAGVRYAADGMEMARLLRPATQG
ncbi:MAG: dihydropteroate synthase, partial [bacterium]|nr:dihydropteroate synthase [bacterium]